MPKFGVPFSGAADEMIGGEKEAAMAAPFPSDQEDDSRMAGHSHIEASGHDGYEPMAMSDRDGHKPMHRMRK